MDQLIPRKPQDIDRWSDQAEHDPVADPTTGPQDRWANESMRPDPDYPAANATEGGLSGLNADLEDDGTTDRAGGDDPAIRGQAR